MIKGNNKEIIVFGNGSMAYAAGQYINEKPGYGVVAYSAV
jgi:hypothetical protein